jgi:hypothetical protein
MQGLEHKWSASEVRDPGLYSRYLLLPLGRHFFTGSPARCLSFWKALNQSSNFLLVSDLYPLNLFNGQQISGAVINPGG